MKVAQCLASGEGGSFAGDLSLRFPSDPLEDDEEPIDGIELIIMNSVAILDEAGFLELMFRFLNVVIRVSEETGEPCVFSEWWPEIKSARDALRNRFWVQNN